MTDEIFLDEDEKDALTEVFNIAIGTASSVLADLMEVFVNMHVPDVNIVGLEGIELYLQDSLDEHGNYYIANQLFSGVFSGESLIIVDEESTKKLAMHLEGDDDKDLVSDVFLELSNVITTGFINKLGDELGINFSLAQPSTDFRHGNQLVSFSAEHDTKFIITNMVVEINEIQLTGQFLLLSKPEALLQLKSYLNKYIEELLGD